MTGDRIAIISRGSLLCCGSFEYLKHRFGRGNRLTLVIRSQNERKPSQSSHTFTVTADVTDDSVTDSISLSSMTPSDYPLSENIEAEITGFLQEFIAGATLVDQRGHGRGRELHYLLPILESRPCVLSRLFSELDARKANLGIISYGMTSCNMEEVRVHAFIQCIIKVTLFHTL